MRRWQLTAVLVVLAAAGISLATGLPTAAVAAIAWLSRPVEPEPVTWDPPVGELPTQARPPREPVLIPELGEPIAPVPVLVLPPDPVPVRYGCGGIEVADGQPLPACGMG